jgi:hypothetical protein
MASVGAISARATSFRYHPEETAKAHILKKHPGRMSAFCFAAPGTRFPPGLSQDRGRSVSGFLVDPGGDLVTGRLPESLAGILAALPGPKATS